jgi:hypothetical protein
MVNNLCIQSDNTNTRFTVSHLIYTYRYAVQGLYLPQLHSTMRICREGCVAVGGNGGGCGSGHSVVPRGG